MLNQYMRFGRTFIARLIIAIIIVIIRETLDASPPTPKTGSKAPFNAMLTNSWYVRLKNIDPKTHTRNKLGSYSRGIWGMEFFFVQPIFQWTKNMISESENLYFLSNYGCVRNSIQLPRTASRLWWFYDFKNWFNPKLNGIGTDTYFYSFIIIFFLFIIFTHSTNFS